MSTKVESNTGKQVHLFAFLLAINDFKDTLITYVHL